MTFQLSAQFTMLITPGLTTVGIPSETTSQDTVTLEPRIITPEQVVETLKAFNIGHPPEGQVKVILFPQPEQQAKPFESAQLLLSRDCHIPHVIRGRSRDYLCFGFSFSVSNDLMKGKPSKVKGESFMKDSLEKQISFILSEK